MPLIDTSVKVFLHTVTVPASACRFLVQHVRKLTCAYDMLHMNLATFTFRHSVVLLGTLTEMLLHMSIPLKSPVSQKDITMTDIPTVISLGACCTLTPE